MRIAVLSDIHGNLAALDAVLADVARSGANLTVNLGDICSGALFPKETADRLMALDLPTIRGNHERQVLTLPRDRMGLSDRHALDTLEQHHLAWFDSLPDQLTPVPGVLMVHGTPRSDVEYWLETVEPTGLRPATDAEVAERLAGAEAEVVLCGHTHLPRAVRIEGGPLVINPGSVGLPAYDDDRPWPHVVETGSPHARYALIETRDGQWTADLRTVAYDWGAAARVARANGREDWARALGTGRV